MTTTATWNAFDAAHTTGSDPWFSESLTLTSSDPIAEAQAALDELAAGLLEEDGYDNGDVVYGAVYLTDGTTATITATVVL